MLLLENTENVTGDVTNIYENNYTTKSLNLSEDIHQNNTTKTKVIILLHKNNNVRSRTTQETYKGSHKSTIHSHLTLTSLIV